MKTKKQLFSHVLTITVGLFLAAVVLLPMLLSKQIDTSSQYYSEHKVPDHGRIWPEY